MTRNAFGGLALLLAACSGSHEADATPDALDGGESSDVAIEAGRDSSDLPDAPIGDPDGSSGCELTTLAIRWERIAGIGMLGNHGVGGVTVLGSGRVAVVGSDDGAGGGVNVYDPSTDSWTALGSTPLINNTATRLPSGKVLGVGNGALWGPTEPRDRFITQGVAMIVSDDEITGTTAPRVSRMVHAATLLDNRVMIAGGWHAEYVDEPGGDTVGRVLVEAEAYDEGAESWEDLAPMNEARWAFSLTVLDNGHVLAAGGFDSTHIPLSSAEIYDPESNTWTTTGSMGSPHAWHEAQRLPSGGVLVMGGYASRDTLTATAEVFDPTTGTWSSAPDLPEPFAEAASARLSSGRVLLAGGYMNAEEFRVYPTAFLLTKIGGVGRAFRHSTPDAFVSESCSWLQGRCS